MFNQIFFKRKNTVYQKLKRLWKFSFDFFSDFTLIFFQINKILFFFFDFFDYWSNNGV